MDTSSTRARGEMQGEIALTLFRALNVNKNNMPVAWLHPARMPCCEQNWRDKLPKHRSMRGCLYNSTSIQTSRTGKFKISASCRRHSVRIISKHFIISSSTDMEICPVSSAISAARLCANALSVELCRRLVPQTSLQLLSACH